MSRLPDCGIRFNPKHQDSKIEILKPVLNNWISIVSEYSKAFKMHDACWWYTERANVGILAAAAWRTKGWLALEEYSTLKHGDDSQSKNGRCDLYMAKKDHSISFALEAKPAWQTMRSDGSAKIVEKLAAAWDDVGRLNKLEASTRVAACFAIPRMPTNHGLADKNRFDDEIKKWLEGTLLAIKWDAVAWVFPVESRQLSHARRSTEHIYPGVLLILQERRRASKSTKN